MRAKKSFGQHFLTNEDIARRIADSLKTLDGERETGAGARPCKVLEIGPGKGMLTKYLLEKDIDLKLVEADADMVEYLNDNFPLLWGNIIFLDFMKLDLTTVFTSPLNKGDKDLLPPPAHHPPATASQFSIIGNFPYNISSQIVFRMVEHRHLIPELVGMFQKEMAERIIAPPGGKDYGVISVLTQAFYSGEYLFTVGNQNFNPPPRVQSAVIRLLRKEKELDCDETLFRRVVKQAFSQRRKMLRNTLKPFFRDPASLAEDFFRLRPEVLSVQDFVELTNRIAQIVP